MKQAKILEIWDGILFQIYNFLVDILFIFTYPSKRKFLKKNKELKNKHLGEECYLVLNGPSVNEHDLSFLKDKVVICTNGFYKSDLAKVVDPNYYCFEDNAIIELNKNNDLVKDVRKHIPNAKMILSYKGYSGNEDGVYYTYNKHQPNYFGIKNNLCGICSNFMNVSFYAINVAIYMGFEKIYIIGMDFEPTGFKHFDSECGPDEINKYTSVTKDETCVYHWCYMKAQYESFDLAKYANKNNVEIVNLNKNSFIRSFAFNQI